MRAGALAALAVVTSCSFGLSGPADGTPPGTPPSCTTSRTRPVLDTVGAALFGGAGLAYLLARCGAGDHDQDVDQTCEAVTNAIGVVLLIPGVIYGISAAGGYVKTSRCRDAVRDHQEYRARPHVTSPAG